MDRLEQILDKVFRWGGDARDGQIGKQERGQPSVNYWREERDKAVAQAVKTIKTVRREDYGK